MFAVFEYINIFIMLINFISRLWIIEGPGGPPNLPLLWGGGEAPLDPPRGGLLPHMH